MDSDLGNLVVFLFPTHTPLTYHRTWETGLGVGILGSPLSAPIFSSPKCLN